MKRLIIIITVSALTALTVFSQHYSKHFLNESSSGSFIYQAFPINDEAILFNHKSECDSILYCGGISQFNNDADYSMFFDSHTEEYTVNNLKLENDLIYISSYNASPINSKSFWFFKVFTREGEIKTLTKYEMPTPFNSYNINYGLEHVKNDEIILWGNGFDPLVQNTNDSIKIVWLRIKKDGTLISGPHYWKPSDTKQFGIATDASVNAAGNMVFIRENFDWNVGIFRCIYEIDSADQVRQITKVKANVRKYDYARMCVTKDNHLIMYTAEHNRASPLPRFYKLNYNNDTLWSLTLPRLKSPYFGVGSPQDNLNQLKVNRIRKAENGDILFCGTNAFIDSMYNHKYKRIMLMSDLGGGFFGRISPDGKLKWVHYMVSIKNATDCNYITPNDINEMPNGDILIGGSMGTSPDTLDFTYQAWIMRVNYIGCFDNDCSHVDKWWFFPEQFPVGTNDLTKYSNDIILFPNPFGQSVTISIPEYAVYPLQFQITNTSGQTLLVGTIVDKSHNVIETGHLQSGTYIVGIKDQKGIIHYQKGIKI